MADRCTESYKLLPMMFSNLNEAMDNLWRNRLMKCSHPSLKILIANLSSAEIVNHYDFYLISTYL